MTTPDDRPYRVEIRGAAVRGLPQLWGYFRRREKALRTAATLRKYGFEAVTLNAQHDVLDLERGARS
jgi:hypothetical protein